MCEDAQMTVCVCVMCVGVCVWDNAYMYTFCNKLAMRKFPMVSFKKKMKQRIEGKNMYILPINCEVSTVIWFQIFKVLFHRKWRMRVHFWSSEGCGYNWSWSDYYLYNILCKTIYALQCKVNDTMIKFGGDLITQFIGTCNSMTASTDRLFIICVTKKKISSKFFMDFHWMSK